MENQLLLIIDRALSSATVARAIAALSIQFGNREVGVVGPEVIDSDGNPHSGRVQVTSPVLRASHESMARVADVARAWAEEVSLYDLNSLASRSRTHDEYVDLMQTTPAHDIAYQGIALYGDRQAIKKIVDSVGLV